MSKDSPEPTRDPLGLQPILNFLSRHQRVLMAGLFLVAGILIVYQALGFLSSRAEAKGWNAYFDQKADAPPVQVERELDGTKAEPWFLFRSAEEAYRRKDLAAAADFAQKLRDRYPHHYLNYARAYPRTETLADEVSAAIKAQSDWDAAHPMVDKNPDPSKDQTCVLKTAKGDIVLGLYLDKAPESCRFFLKNAAAMKGEFIRTVSPDQFIVVGQPATQPDSPPKPDEEEKAPAEVSGLYHFKGAVSLEATYFAAPGQSNLPLWVCLAPALYRDDHSTVFATVLDGMDRIAEWSKLPRSDKSSDLVEPIKIEDVEIRVTAPGFAPEPAPEAAPGK
jgi:cyclophilin family peptidyl-prolyl cis-trans isomerase